MVRPCGAPRRVLPLKTHRAAVLVPETVRVWRDVRLHNARGIVRFASSPVLQTVPSGERRRPSTRGCERGNLPRADGTAPGAFRKRPAITPLRAEDDLLGARSDA